MHEGEDHRRLNFMFISPQYESWLRTIA